MSTLNFYTLANVLFKHALDYAYQVRGHFEPKSICFVTVSPSLRKELKKRYEDIEKIERVSLPGDEHLDQI
jgi:hypothetical protein